MFIILLIRKFIAILDDRLNSILPAKMEYGKNRYFEVSYIHSKAKMGSNVLF